MAQPGRPRPLGPPSEAARFSTAATSRTTLPLQDAQKNFKEPVSVIRSLKTLEDPLALEPTGTATLEDAGRLRLFPTRSGRGEQFGEPLTDARTSEAIVYISFADGDTDNPINWSKRKKQAHLYTVVFMAACTACNVASYSLGFESARQRLGGDLSQTLWTLANTLHFLAIAIAPLALAPLSELFGRLQLFHYSTIILAVLFIPQALSPNIAGIIVARAIQGLVASVGNSCVGGAIADIFESSERGAALNMFSLFIFVGQSIGPGALSWVNEKLSYQWMFWILLILCTISFVLNVVVLRETRANVILAKRAASLTKQTGRLHASVGESSSAVDFWTMVRVSVSRPILFLVSEPIVAYISLWVGVCWSICFLFIASCPIVYAQYGWSLGESGSTLWTIGLGGAVGYMINLYQDGLYDKATVLAGCKPEPEVRLYCASVAAFMFPIAIIMYAWTARPGIHPAVGIVALTLVFASLFVIYSAVREEYVRWFDVVILARLSGIAT